VARPWFKFYADRWLGSGRVTECTAAQQGIYARLLANEWQLVGAGLPGGSPLKCRPFAPWDATEADLVAVVEQFYPESEDGRRRSAFMQTLIEAEREFLALQQAKGQAGGKARAQAAAKAGAPPKPKPRLKPVPESRVPESLSSELVPSSDHKYLKVATRFAERVDANLRAGGGNPRARTVKALTGDAVEWDRLIRLDLHGNDKAASDAARFVLSDPFWSTTCRTLSNLRDKWDSIQASIVKRNGQAPGVDVDALAERGNPQCVLCVGKGVTYIRSGPKRGEPTPCQCVTT